MKINKNLRNVILIVLVAALVLSLFIIFSKEKVEETEVVDIPVSNQEQAPQSSQSTPEPPISQVTENSGADFSKYNFQFVDNDEIKGLLDSHVAGKRVFFNLPPSGYINVSKGTSYGIAFAINNIDPIKDDYFEYEFTPDSSTYTNCKVNQAKATSWIAMGFKSFGKIPEGWIDKMTVFFKIPSDTPNCKAVFNFELKKNHEIYATQKIELNIIN